MAVRLKDWEVPYTWWVGIEITNNHIINVLLREANNLIHVNENREIYVDLQLPDGIEPDDDFPVWVTTGKILQEDWWPQSWLILNWKTTSGDYARLIYANDWNVYIDCGDWIWRLLWEGSSILNCNTRTFWIETNQDIAVAQALYDWYKQGNNALVIHENQGDLECYTLSQDLALSDWRLLEFATHQVSLINGPAGYTTVRIPLVQIKADLNDEIDYISFQDMRRNSFIDPTATSQFYDNAFIPTEDFHPTTKKYVDDELLKKQDLLTPWTRITIQTDPQTGNLVISADVTGVMTYKGNLQSVSDLANVQNPAVWDCYYIEWASTMYAWDGTQWNDIWWTAIDLTNYFNKVTNTSDDITEWSVNLFVTQSEKNTWSGKQDEIRAGRNITIDADGRTINAQDTTYTSWNWISISWANNEIENTLPFDPENAGTMGMILQKTNNGYKWANVPTWWHTYSWGTWINVDNTNDTIENTLPFDPSNQWSAWQVLKKTLNWYQWANESGWWHTYTGSTWISVDNQNNTIENTLPFNPDNQGSTGQYLKKTANGYEWANWWGGGWTTYTWWHWINVDNSADVIENTLPFEPNSSWLEWYILRMMNGYYDWQPEWNTFDPSNQWSDWDFLIKTSQWYKWSSDLPSGKNNVKFWTIDSTDNTTFPLATRMEIYMWLNESPNNGAVINDTHTNDVYIFHGIDSQSRIAIFYWVNRNSEKREWTGTGWTSHWWYTVAWQNEFDIYDATLSYAFRIWENQNDITHTNYISALGAQYPAGWYFNPTNETQPATKWYVDAVAAWTVQVPALTCSTTGTNITLVQERAWTQAQYDALVNNNQIAQWVIYNIIPSS